MKPKPWHAFITPINGVCTRRVGNKATHRSLIAAIKRELKGLDCGRYILEVYHHGVIVSLTIER